MMDLEKITLETETIETEKGYWNKTLVRVLYEGEKLTEYVRSYPSHSKQTFCPFHQRDDEGNIKTYALFAGDYYRTAVMELPSGKEIAKEAYIPGVGGFCPVDYYVPYEEEHEFDLNGRHVRIVGPSGQFGFVSGCFWGDDTSWKIEYLDLSRVSEGIIKRDARFGYIEYRTGVRLSDLIDVDNYEEVYEDDTLDYAHRSVGIHCLKNFYDIDQAYEDEKENILERERRVQQLIEQGEQ